MAEDNLPDALLVREAIQAENLPLEIHIVPDGELALDFLQRSEEDEGPPAPQLLLLDLNLPKIDGFEVLRRVRQMKTFQNVPVLFVTSSDSPSDRKEAARLGASYFRKPVSYEEFVKLGGVLRRFLEDNGLLTSGRG